MHELGVVFHIADSVMNVARQNGANRVTSVTLQIGEVSTVVPEYLRDVWNWNCKRNTMLDGCRLEIERIHAVTHCTNCGKNYDTVPQGITCPACGSNKTFLVKGNEMNIKDITVV